MEFAHSLPTSLLKRLKLQAFAHCSHSYFFLSANSELKPLNLYFYFSFKVIYYNYYNFLMFWDVPCSWFYRRLPLDWLVKVLSRLIATTHARKTMVSSNHLKPNKTILLHLPTWRTNCIHAMNKCRCKRQSDWLFIVASIWSEIHTSPVSYGRNT